MPNKPRQSRSSNRSSTSPSTRNEAMTLLQSLMRGNQQLMVQINEQPLTLTQAMALAEQRLKEQQPQQAQNIYQQLLEQAAQWHRDKRLDDAEAVYRQVFEAEPAYIDALHLLGVIYSQRGDHATAERLIRQALRESPDTDTYHNNLGKALQGLGRLEEAVDSYQRTLALNSGHVLACNNLGKVLLELGRREEAIARFRQAVALRPDFNEAQRNLEQALQRPSKSEGAG
ncbi:MAG: tetratricopeptide repeat protein [Candidatus Contendobacter sp.]|nr:tetratricopeptide repeat protein [Candidatus Contendobacter sp.]